MATQYIANPPHPLEISPVFVYNPPITKGVRTHITEIHKKRALNHRRRVQLEAAEGAACALIGARVSKPAYN